MIKCIWKVGYNRIQGLVIEGVGCKNNKRQTDSTPEGSDILNCRGEFFHYKKI